MVREMTDEKEFMERNAQAAEETRVDMEDRPQKRLTDSRAWELIRRSGGRESAEEFQRSEKEQRSEALRKAPQEGVSIRQASRLTEIGIGVVRRFTDG